MNGVMTILEGRVLEEKWKVLMKAYEKVLDEKAEIMPINSYLIQRKDDPELWRIVSVWESEETLQKMKDSGEVPAGVRIFKEAGAEPTLSIFNIKFKI